MHTKELDKTTFVDIDNALYGIVVYRQLFNVEECHKILNNKFVWDKQEGSVYDAKDPKAGGDVNHDTRKCTVYHRQSQTDKDWITDRLALAYNDYKNSFRDAPVADPYSTQMEIVEYLEEADHFAEHPDIHINPQAFKQQRQGLVRKISTSTLLNRPEEFEGCDISFRTKPNEARGIPLERGDCLMFPSYYMHKVNPLIKGERRVLITWMHGDFWK